MIEGLRGGRTPELGMVAPRDGRETTQGNIGCNISEIKEWEAKGGENHAVRARGICRSRAISQDAGTETGDAQVVR